MHIFSSKFPQWSGNWWSTQDLCCHMNGPQGTGLLLGGSVCPALWRQLECQQTYPQFQSQSSTSLSLQTERVKQRDDCPVAWVTLLPTCPQLGREHLHQLSYTAHLHIFASLPLRIKTDDYPLTESKGNVGYKSKQKGNRLINKIHANRKVARVACSLRIGRGCAELETLGFVSSCAFFFSQIPLSLCQDNSCIFCSWADTGNQILSVSITILPREITHLELNYSHKLLRISDCYRCC